MGVQSLLVEGGARVHASFLAAGLYDEVNVFYAPVFIGGDGLPMTGPLGVERMEQAVRTPSGRLLRLGGDFLFNAVLREV
jgi:diaminohydroxyphosphoribosylaminopyrimidine deaminase/5-amino-6-(5-phosphoribosylamino)uracil reductase